MTGFGKICQLQTKNRNLAIHNSFIKSNILRRLKAADLHFAINIAIYVANSYKLGYPLYNTLL